MPVETVYECLYRWLVEMSQIGRSLPWFVAHHESLRIDEAKSIYNDLALDRLYRIYYDSDSSRCKLFEGLLRVYVNR